MTLHLPTLNAASILLLVLSALALAGHGRVARAYRGFAWWLAAHALLATGMALLALRETQPQLTPLAHLLVLQWPITVLGGMRRFCARSAWRVGPLVDGLLLATAYTAWLAGWAGHVSLATRVAVFALASGLLHAYAAWLVSRLADARSGGALKAVGWLLAGGAAWQVLRVGQVLAVRGGWLPADPDLLIAGVHAATPAALAMAGLALLLGSERTEARLREQQRRLRVLADIDTLTGVPNRRHFHELAERLLAAGEPARVTVLMFDIDHFKRINDLLGHAVGDEALRQVALCTRETLRGPDVAGRLGGDEFGVLLPGTSMADAMSVASRIVERLEHRQVAPRLAPLRLSFGVVQMQPEETLADALRRADQALYEAKRQGRSRAVSASGDESRPVFGESRSLGLPQA